MTPDRFHEEVRDGIPAFVAGQLAEDEVRRLEAHLTACEDCADLVFNLRWLGDAIGRHGDAMFEPHPDPAELARMARGKPVLDRERLERHLAVCAACRLETAGWSTASSLPGAQREAPVPKTAPPLARAVKTAALPAAGLIVGLLLGYLAAPWRSPWNGPIDLPVLQRATRGSAAITRIHVKPGQEALVVAVRFDPPDARPETEILQYQVLSSDGAVIYTLREPLERLRRHAGSSGVVPLLIDSRQLPPGSYRVVLTGAGGPQDTIAVTWFEVEPSPTGG